MKKLLFVLLAALFIASCVPVAAPIPEAPAVASPEPVAEKPGPETQVHFYFSSWEEVTLGATSSLARSIISKATVDLGAAMEAQAEYNATHTDDAILGPYVGDAVSITEAPEADGYIVNPLTHEKLAEYLDIPRSELVTNRQGWQLEAEQVSWRNNIKDNAGNYIPCLVYVDHEPPTVIYMPPAPKLWVALLDLTAKKVYYSEHYDTEPEALQRFRMGMSPQADQYNMYDIADGIDVPGDVWQAYLGDTEATFQEAP